MKSYNYAKNIFSVSMLLFSSIISGDEIGHLVVKELLDLSGAKKQYDQMIIVMTDNMKDGFYQGFNGAIEGKNVSKEMLSEKKAIYTKKFSLFVEDFKSFMHEEISWDVMVSKVYSPVYLKHLTVDEIKEITYFYKSKTGAKFAAISPQLIQDSSNKFNEIYGAKLNDFAIQAAKKRMDEASYEINALCKEKC